MKKTFILLTALLLLLSGCASDDYQSRIETLENTVSAQADQIAALEQAVFSSEINKPEPEATPEQEVASFFKFANLGPETILVSLPENYSHPFPEETIERASLCKDKNGKIMVGILYANDSYSEKMFHAFNAAVSGQIQDISEDSGFIVASDASYNIL